MTPLSEQIPISVTALGRVGGAPGGRRGRSPNLRFEFPASWPGPNWAGTPRLELVSRERASRRPRGPLADPLPLDLRRGMPQSVESSASSVFRSQVRALRAGFVWIPVRYRASASGRAIPGVSYWGVRRARVRAWRANSYSQFGLRGRAPRGVTGELSPATSHGKN